MNTTTTATNPAPSPKTAPQKPSTGPQKTAAPDKAPSPGSGSKSSPGGHDKPSKGSGGTSSSSSAPGKSPTTSPAPAPAPAQKSGSATGTKSAPTSPAPKSPAPTRPTGSSGTSASKPTDSKPSTTTPSTKATDTKDSGSSSEVKADSTNRVPGPRKHDAPEPKKPEGTATGGKESVRLPEPMLTRDARETGYRDGTRAGRAAAKTRAYGHGIQDGWHAVMDNADDEKALLDRARDLRKERKDPPVTTMPLIPPPPTSPPTVTPDTPAPVAPAAQPLTVTGINATTVYLGDDANRPSMTRGEVRSLKGFERRLTDHHGQVQTVAEATKGLAFHASQQADSITRLLEQAKGVKGGEKLLATLARLQEAAQAQVVLAEETHRRAVRGADATGAVLANTITRYGAIYQAVVDSDETAPAELSFYEG
ncbi:hypothetical protein [Streptomyces zaomyceticus]|uniref:hypothetical protein n=1 Tax=Streptomyces zaomyceticus TaxID=68286 RepID=UPI0037B23F6E